MVSLSLPGLERPITFRPLTRAEADALLAHGDGDLDYVLRLTAALADPAQAGPVAALQDETPLLFHDVLRAVLEDTVQRRQARDRRAVALWRRAERSPGVAAENLLAFVNRGAPRDWSEHEIAGALMVVDWAQATRGILQLFLGLMKGLAKRR
jgi:hypothetical protein